ncbi:hypothetical protein D3C78_1872940 [compost metagenome]
MPRPWIAVAQTATESLIVIRTFSGNGLTSLLGTIEGAIVKFQILVSDDGLTRCPIVS